MADNDKTGEGQGNIETGEGQGGIQTGAAGQSGNQGERTYTQAEVDELLGGMVEQSEVNRLVGEARRKTRLKYEGYDEFKAHAEAWADYDEVVADRDKAQGEVATLTARIEHMNLVEKVHVETGVPSALLKGDTEDELRASAEAVKAYAGAQATQTPPYPEDKGGGKTPPPVTREQIESIKDPVERVKMRAQHIGLYR